MLNDHRTFLPYVGLVTAATWALGLGLARLAAVRPALVRPPVVAALALALIAGHAYGTHRRNGRGLMNYGLSQMRQGRYDRARGWSARWS